MRYGALITASDDNKPSGSCSNMMIPDLRPDTMTAAAQKTGSLIPSQHPRITPLVVFAHPVATHRLHLEIFREDTKMAWTKPIAVEINCGMEINMYGPSDDDRGAERDLF